MYSIIQCFRQLAPKISDLIATGDTHYTQNQNQSGDIQLALDIQSDLLIEKALLDLPCVKGVCSEEKGEILSKEKGEYFVAYDPIDGSSLIGANLSVGTIFGIYLQDLNAKSLVASGYILYGPRLEMISATNEGILYQRYHPQNQRWETQPTLKLEKKGKINACGGTQKFWHPKHKQMIDSLFASGYRLRYSGGMVPDLHQILIKQGGLFSYPATSDAPQGKLRKLFEVFPFAFIFEKAGGEAIDGQTRLLDLEVCHIHDTSPCFFGSTEEIQLVQSTYKEI